jgi:hypothetical protein
MTPAEYSSLSLDEVAVGLDATARDSEAWFGLLDATQLNWRPDATRWRDVGTGAFNRAR